MSYTPPVANALNFNFSSGGYSAPGSTVVKFAFGDVGPKTAALTGATATTRAGSITYLNGLAANLTGAQASTRAGVVYVVGDTPLVGAKCKARAGTLKPVGSMQRQYVFDILV